MIIVMRGWWQHFQARRRHRRDVRAFQRLMDAREAARRSAWVEARHMPVAIDPGTGVG